MRICIIGAGAAGLSAAHALRQKGYEKITIFEQATSVGGKCHSFIYEGRYYELGAVALYPLPDYQEMHRLVAELGMVTERFQGKQIFLKPDGTQTSPISASEIPAFLVQFLRYLTLRNRYKKVLDRPGFKDLPSELAEPFSAFLDRHHLPLLKVLNCACNGFGYADINEVSAAYYLKRLAPSKIFNAVTGKIYFCPTGLGNVWRNLAEHYDVRLEETIKGIDRSSEKIMISTDNGHDEFDKLIIACPLDKAISFIDASSTEQTLSSKVLYNDYYSFSFILNNFVDRPNVSYGWFPLHYNHKDYRGHAMFWYRRYLDSDLYTVYTLGSPAQTEAEVEAIIRQDLLTAGATIKEKITARKWRFFPHVSPVDIENGFYDQIENLQGKNNTYFVGELLCFALTSYVTEYSYNLVHQHF